MDTAEITRRQRAFFLSGRTLDVAFRREALLHLKRNISAMEDEIAAAVASDLGKSSTETYMCETGLVLGEISTAIRHMGRWGRPRKVRTPLAQFPASSRIVPEPYGTVLIMSPWNYPFLLSISPLVSAIAAGNTAVVKPSAYSPATGSVISRLIRETFPEEHAAAVEGGREANAELLDQKFDYIFFTGSKTVGKLVMSKAAMHLTPVTLELGGKSPVIVDRTADIRTSAARIVFGKYLNSGQTCVAPDHAFVHEDVLEEFIRECREQIKVMFGNDISQCEGYGRIVNRKHFDRLVSYLAQCSTGTASIPSIEYGGRDFPDTLQIEPSIVRMGSIGELDGETGQTFLMQEEIFGPILPVISYRNTDDVMHYISARPKPLAAYFFTGDRNLKRRLVRELHFGGGCINDTVIHLATDRMPFGGVGESGMGSYHGKFGFMTFSHMKSIVDKPSWLDLPMRYQPYTHLKDRIIRLFLK